jgi:hypothetical protein
LETELEEALNNKRIYLKSDRGTQLVNPDLFNEYPKHFSGNKVSVLTVSTAVGLF